MNKWILIHITFNQSFNKVLQIILFVVICVVVIRLQSITSVEFPAMSPRGYSRALTATNIVGVLLSVYALYVEMALEAKPDYKALCDISERMSCTKVLGSSYARGFGVAESIAGKESVFNIPNCAQGIVFYLLMIFLATFDHTTAVKLQIFLSVLSVLSSVYLAYILYFILYDFCIVCVSTYAVNVANLILVRCKMAALRTRTGNGKSKNQ